MSEPIDPGWCACCERPLFDGANTVLTDAFCAGRRRVVAGS